MGNRNAFSTGAIQQEAIALRRRIAELIRKARQVVGEEKAGGD